MEIDEDKMDDTVLALLLLTLHDGRACVEVSIVSVR